MDSVQYAGGGGIPAVIGPPHRLKIIFTRIVGNGRANAFDNDRLLMDSVQYAGGVGTPAVNGPRIVLKIISIRILGNGRADVVGDH